RQLINHSKLEKIDVAVRPPHPGLEQLRTLAGATPERLEIAVESAEIASRLARCQFAITSGSNWSIELACIGVPQLIIIQSEVHWPTAHRLEDEGVATCIGWHETVSTNTIRLAIHILPSDLLERQDISRCGRKLIDGRGP